MTDKRVYLDYNATTPVHEAVLAAMRPYWRDCFANPSSGHSDALRAREAVNRARAQVAAAVGAKPSQVVFTSSGTESNNALIKGVAKMSMRDSVAVAATEHPCVLCAARSLRDSFKVNFLAVDENGLVEKEEVEEALAERCALLSVMAANNETGVRQDIPALAAKARAAGTIMHTDATQALGKIPVSFDEWGVDAMTLSAHKCYGPKGVAALIVREEVAWAPLLEGGGHERGHRSGTENVPGIVGFGVACEQIGDFTPATAAIEKMRDNLEAELTAAGATIFAQQAPRLPNTCYFGFDAIDGDAMVSMLDQSGFSVAAGAACSSMKDEPSHVLLAMGVDIAKARTAVRVSLGAPTTEAEVESFAAVAKTLASQLLSMQSVLGH